MNDETNDFAAIRRQIEDFVLRFDPMELLIRISRLSNFVPASDIYHNWTLREMPFLYLLTSICLRSKTDKFVKAIPTSDDLEQIIALLEQFVITYNYHQIYVSSTSKSQAVRPVRYDADSATFSARLQKMIGDINPSAYFFQMHDLTIGVFEKFNDYFIKKFGFSVENAWEFGGQILERYERRINENLLNLLGEGKLEDVIRSSEGRLNFTDPLFSNSEDLKSVFLFTLDEFCATESIKDSDSFQAYLDTFSCEFGDEMVEFETPLDEGIILTHPIIKMDKVYFAPIPANLLSNLPILLERLLEKEKRTQSKIWQKFQKRKAEFTDEKVYEYLTRLFPKPILSRNLTYRYLNELCEVDLIFGFDNKLFIIENKSGSLTPPAKRGAVNRLKTDLKKLIGDAYNQCRRTQEFISSVKTAKFFDKDGRNVLEIIYNPKHIDVFLINVTLEPLMSFAADLKRLECFGLYDETVRLWSVSLFELDIITRHIPSPTILIHYLERRLDAQEEGVFHAFDELSYFGWYLDSGNFYVPLTDDGEVPDIVSMDGWIDEFDNHYLFGADPPRLKLEPEFVEMIQFIESEQLMGYSNLASALLDLPRKARIDILEKIHDLTNQTRQDKLPHDFSLYFEKFSLGLTFMSRIGHENFEERLAGFCTVKKYETKVQRWVGIGKDVTNQTTVADMFFYAEGDWESDAELDRLVEKLEQQRRHKHDTSQ